MKKLIIYLLILIIAGGVVFYFGWVQIDIPAGDYAVAVTKTGGYDEDVMKPGEFIWRWERLIPTNFTLHTFSLEPQSIDITVEGSLPSGETYAENYTEDVDFSYEIRLTMNYQVNPEKLPTLVAEEGLTNENLDTWYGNFEGHISSFVSTFFKKKASTGNLFKLETISFKSFEEELLTQLRQNHPQLQFHSLYVKKFTIPDIALYQKARRAFYDIMDIRHQVLVDEIEESAQAEADEIKRIELLREYGKLLTEYPILLKYLTLEQGQKELGEDILPDILSEE